MSQLIELDDKYFQEMLIQANRVCSVIQDPELKKQAFALTYEALLELNSERLEFDDDEADEPEHDEQAPQVQLQQPQ